MLAIYLNHAGLAVSFFDRGSHPSVRFCHFFSQVDLSGLASVLTRLIDDNHWKGVACSWVLDPSCYQLLKTDALSVPDYELQDAVGWQIKDRLDNPLDDMVIDVFKIPAHGIGHQKKMLYAVAAEKAYLKAGIAAIKKSGLKPVAIDITELALRNILSFFKEPEQSLAMLALQPHAASMIITCQDHLYLSRQSRWVNGQADELLLEIKRSYDYYTSQLNQKEPKKLVIAAVSDVSIDWMASLNDAIDSELELLQLTDLISLNQSIDNAMQQQCLVAIGGSLRDDN